MDKLIKEYLRIWQILYQSLLKEMTYYTNQPARLQTRRQSLLEQLLGINKMQMNYSIKNKISKYQQLDNKLLFFISQYLALNRQLALLINSHKRRMCNRLLFSLATAAFLMIALLTLMDELFAHTAFRVVLALYSLAMTVVELSSFSSICQQPLMQMASHACAVLGYLTFMEAAYLYGSFNKGNIYIIGSFFISLSALLKLLQIIMGKSISMRKIMKNPYGFVRIGCLAGVGLFFFITSIAQGLRDSSSFQTLIFIAKSSNLMAAGLHIIALYNMHKEEDLKQVEKIRFEISAGELNLT